MDPLSGEIFVHAPLDRERTPKHSLKIAASDQPTNPANKRSPFIFINVQLIDVNDNKPLFNTGSYYAAVKETVGVGHDVITVQASDADEGDRKFEIQNLLNERQYGLRLGFALKSSYPLS